MERNADLLKEGVRVLSQALLAMEVQQHVGAAPHERNPRRTGRRNGYRERSWDRRVGTVELKVPRVRNSGYFPSLLEPRRKVEIASAAVVQEAYVHGVSTRKVDELVKALGMAASQEPGIRAVQSELCKELDEGVERLRSRPLEGPYLWVDATNLESRQDGRVASTAVVIAAGVNGNTGKREVLGLDVGPSEDGEAVAYLSRLLINADLLPTGNSPFRLGGRSRKCRCPDRRWPGRFPAPRLWCRARRELLLRRGGPCLSHRSRCPYRHRR
jgi:putative transposase